MPRTRPKPIPSRTQAVRVALAARGWSQTDLAERLGVTRQRVSDVLSGRVPASDVWWLSVAAALDLDAAALGLPVPRAPRELVLTREDDGPGLVAMGARSEALLAEWGWPPSAPIRATGPGWSRLVERAREAGAAVTLRFDLPAPG